MQRSSRFGHCFPGSQRSPFVRAVEQGIYYSPWHYAAIHVALTVPELRSPHIICHHSNWRQQAIESLLKETIHDLHYSSVVSLSRKDVEQIKSRLMDAVSDNIETIRASEEEEVYSLCIDFFSLGK